VVHRLPDLPRASYLLGRSRGGTSLEILRVYRDVLAAVDMATILSKAEPMATYSVVARSRRTVLVARGGLGHWVRIAR